MRYEIGQRAPLSTVAPATGTATHERAPSRSQVHGPSGWDGLKLAVLVYSIVIAAVEALMSTPLDPRV